MHELEGARAREAAPPAAAASAPRPRADEAHAAPQDPVFARGPAGLLAPFGLTLSGYLQTQYESSQLSQDQLQPGGVPYNRDRFTVRRARLRVDGSWRYFAGAVEIDGNTEQVASFGLRRAEASVLLPSPVRGRPPLVMATAGLTEIPFGRELTESNRVRAFMERSVASRAFFRGEPDVGLRVSGGLGPFRYAVAVMNGLPLGDTPGAVTIPPTAAKDVLGRVGFVTGAPERVRVSGGVSFLVGTGFHAGTDATHDTVSWRDMNENGVIDAGELVGVPGHAATPSRTFAHWAVNTDLEVALRTRLGWTTVYGEVTLATNLDRANFVADPIAAGGDVREFAAYVGVLQEVTAYGLVGFRYDFYDPNSDLLGDRHGMLTSTNSRIHTLSPLVGLAWPGRGRLLFQYDVILDSLARDSHGAPTDLANNQWTARAQVEF